MLLHPGAAEPGAAGFPGSFRFCFPKRFGFRVGGAFCAVATSGSGRYSKRRGHLLLEPIIQRHRLSSRIDACNAIDTAFTRLNNIVGITPPRAPKYFYREYYLPERLLCIFIEKSILPLKILRVLC